MKVIKKGRPPQEYWKQEYECTGMGNNGGGCGAVLLIGGRDVFITGGGFLHDGTPKDSYFTFACCECGVFTDIELPKGVKPKGRDPNKIPEAVPEHKISVVRDFSGTPGPRLRNEGKWSGEEFRNGVLRPAFEKAQGEGAVLRVDLDGTYGYSTGFLDEAFGGLARELGQDVVAAGIRIKSTEEPHLVEEITVYIR